MKEIPLTKPYFDADEIEEIKGVLDSGWVTQGPKVKEFEEGVARKIRSKHAIAVTNCTAALHLALLCSGVSSGDEVLVADYTFPATGHAVLYCGAKPIFVDIDPDSYNINTQIDSGHYLSTPFVTGVGIENGKQAFLKQEQGDDMLLAELRKIYIDPPLPEF